MAARSFSMRTDHLSRDKADLADARAEVEDGLAGLEPFRRIAAAVILFDHFGRDVFKLFTVILDRAAESGFLGAGGGSIAFFDFGADGGLCGTQD